MMGFAPGRALAAASLAALMSVVPALTLAQDFENQIRARQGMMRVQAASLGVLAAMARGNMDYDAEAASAAAGNLAATAMIDQRFFWPEGSSLMDAENTRAMPDIWDDYDAFLGEWNKYVEAANALQGEAGNGLEAMSAALQGVGRSCGACHEAFQQSN